MIPHSFMNTQPYDPDKPRFVSHIFTAIPYDIPRHYWKKHAKRRYIAELGQKSDNLCWACTAYFDFDKTTSDWKAKNKYGNVNNITKRAQACVCCKFVAQICEKLRISKETDLIIKRTTQGYQLSYVQWNLGPSYLTNIANNARANDVHIVESETINLSVVKSWVDSCQEEHGSVCKGNWASVWRHDRPKMRVVDVQQMVLLWPAPSDCSYAVLSYVWGEAKKIRIDNSERNEIDLKPYRSILPRTIQDAITLVKKLGMKYLWVDNLCIQAYEGQSEAAREEDRNKQFGNMHKIYGMAQFCIVAAQGECAGAGLWGISHGSRKDEESSHPRRHYIRPSAIVPNQITINDSTTLVLSTNLPADVKNSLWTTRAWCLQEQLFSVRYLVFYDDQVWYQCKKGMWFEDTPLELKTDVIAHQHAEQRTKGESDSDHRWRTRKQSESELIVACRITELKVDMSSLYTATSSREWREEEVIRIGRSTLVIRSGVFREYQSIVKLYTQRSMTNASDALRAANGLLSVVQDIMSTTMLSGLPECMLDAALLWRGAESLHARQDHCPELHESLPSWSWAGWKGRVEYPSIKRRHHPSHLQDYYLENVRPFLRWSKPRYLSEDGETFDLALVNGTGTGIWYDGHRPEDWQRATKLPDFKPAYLEFPECLKTQQHHLHTWTMQSSRFRTWDRKKSPQHKMISPSDFDCKDYIGELWLDDWTFNPPRNHRQALIVISEAQIFDDDDLNYEFDVHNYPDRFELYNVLFVEFIGSVALRRGIGRVSKRGWGLMKPKWEFIQLG